LTYLARYTHSVAIANSRLLSICGGTVSFRWRDYKDDNKSKVMTLEAGEFIRRFLLHVLPDGFHRIRHYRRAKIDRRLVRRGLVSVPTHSDQLFRLIPISCSD